MGLSVEDRLDILDLYGRYAQTIDFGDAAGWAACFSSDGVFKTPANELVGTEALTAMVANQPATSKGQRHFMSNIVLSGDGATAQGTAYLQLTAPPKEGEPRAIAATGVYRDQLAKTADGWRFTRRDISIER